MPYPNSTLTSIEALSSASDTVPMRFRDACHPGPWSGRKPPRTHRGKRWHTHSLQVIDAIEGFVEKSEVGRRSGRRRGRGCGRRRGKDLGLLDHSVRGFFLGLVRHGWVIGGLDVLNIRL